MAPTITPETRETSLDSSRCGARRAGPPLRVRSRRLFVALLAGLVTAAASASVAAQERATLVPKPKKEAETAEPAKDVPEATPPGSDVGPSPPVDREAFRERIVVTEVLLDVLVTDKSGKVVTGLGPQDFVIEERDQVFDPTSVTFYGAAELEASGAGGGTRSDRYFILLFHDQTQSAPFLIGHQLDAGRWTKRWIDQELRPNDQVAVLAYDVKLKLYQDFTREKESLKRAVDAAVTGKRAPDRFETLSAPELDPDSPSLSINLPADRDLSRSTRKVEQALSLLGHAAEGIAGRKNLLLFSVGFGEVGQSGMWTPDPRYYPDMEQSLNDGNVAVYSIDLISTSRGSPRERAINDALSSISNDTGGRYYYAFANPLAPLRQIAEDNLGYYLISYQTDYEAGTAGYREVRVKVRSGAYTVRARRGYRYGS